MRVFLIILILLSISLVPENIGFNFEFELRALVFAVLICGLIFHFGFSVWRKDDELKKAKFKFGSIDIAFIAVTILTVISFVTKTVSIYAFHYVFVQVGMAVVYFVVRTANLDEILLQSKRIYSIVGIGFIVAIIGLVQFALGKPIISTFGRTSYLGCFLAMNAAIALGTLLNIQYSTRNFQCQSENKITPDPFIKWGVLIAFVVIFGVVILTKSRTALIAMAIVLPMMIMSRFKVWKVIPIKSGFKVGRLKNLIPAFVIISLFVILMPFCGKIIYKIRPMSASGRVLIWKVSAEMFKKNPISGVGFGNFANTYNLYQGEYFASGKGSVINKMTAGQVRHAYNWYLETAVEFGAFGLIVFGIFWWLILVEIFKTFKPHKGHKNTKVDYLNIGMSGAVLCFMIMSLFQFPRMIIPTYLLFNFALAWIVNANEYTDLHISFLTTNEHE